MMIARSSNAHFVHGFRTETFSPVTKTDDLGNISWAKLTNASKLDSEGLRQKENAIKVYHSGAFIYHKKDNASNCQKQKEGTSSWSLPWNRWNPNRSQDKEVEKEEEKHAAQAEFTS
eukprot:3974799-Amphidinium_carterae.1